MISAFAFTIAFAYSAVNGFMRVAIQIQREAKFSFASLYGCRYGCKYIFVFINWTYN